MIVSVLRSSRRVVAFSLFVLMLFCLQAALFAAGPAQRTPQGPHIYVQDTQPVSVNHLGDAAAVQALATGKAQPLSSTSADVDEDGVTDLLVGYNTPMGGAVVFHRGNLDAFAPQSRTSFLAIARGEFPSPFLPNAQVFNVPARPDFLATGNFTGSGHLDLVVASRGGNAVYVFSSDGKGKFAIRQMISLPGAITALAAGQFGQAGAFTSLIVGVSGPQKSFSFSLYRGSPQGPARLASYPLNAPASTVAFGDLDGDLHSDAAVLSGGQVQILHSSSLQLETVSVPVSAVSMALGSFIHDRGLRLQMALLTSDGSIHIAAPSSFDSRAFTPDEARAMWLASLRGQPNPVVPRQAASFNEGWMVVESFASVAPFSDPAATPVLLRTRISSHATDDVMVFNPAASQMAVISHQNVQPGASRFVAGALSIRPYSGSPITALSARVNVDGRPGVILLHDSQVTPFVMMPLPDPTFTVNTTADTVTANGCAPGNPNTCSLREAIIEANASAGADTIMVPAGTYQLTIAPAAGADPHDATTGDLDITDGVSIVGANSATTIVEAGATAGSGIDKIFSINPQGLGAGFDTSISNLTIRFGKNASAAGTGDQFGGALDWSAGFDGAGNLTITSCVITDNATTDGDGGGLSLSNPGGSGTVTITNSTIQNNVANTATTGNGGVGGGILVGSFTPLILTNSQLLNNQASQVTGAMGKGGAINLGAFSHSNIHSSTISGNIAAGDGGGIWTNQGLTIDQGTVISSNTAVAGNGGGLWSDNQDVDLTTLSKVTVTGNSANGNGGGIHVDASSPQAIHINFSRIVNNTAAAGSGLDNINGTVDATDNWWGCNQGPSTAPCNTVNDPNTLVTFDPWIVLSHTPNPAAIAVGATSTLTASFLQDNHGAAIAVGNLSTLIGLPIQFNNPVLGTLSNQQTSIQASGTATATYTATAAGAGHADAVVDAATVTANITNVGPPSIAKAFGAASILLSSNTSLMFTINNSNASAALTGVAFTDTLPSGLVVATPNGLTGSCGGGTITATAASNSISLAGATVAASGSCTFSVNVTGTTAGNKVNTTGAVSSTNGGTGNTATASVIVLPRPDLTITKTHVGNFTPGQVGATYTITVSNVGGGATVGTVTVVDTLPAGLTATNITGTGWACTLNTLTCTRADVLNAGASYPAITLTVNVAANAPPNVVNTATVSGGGELNTANDTASDPTHTSLVPLQIIANGGNLSVTAGSVGSIDFTVESSPGVGLITFSCSGLPINSSCSFNPASENQITATVTMTVTTAAHSGSVVPFGGNSTTPVYAVLFPLLGLAGLGLGRRKGKQSRLRLAMLLAGLLVLLMLAGCGGRSNAPGTPAGSFPLTVTATSPTAQASTTVNLTVL
ncbi:MAG TPA: CSLREA domain-containing protein [Candidatus Angelobacter sp.]|nr:CSLREA domain-containing protein [Candidatus Angelobacter sp.]